MKHITGLSVLGLLVATLVPVSQQIVDGFGGNFLPMLKTLLLYYGLFDYCGHAVEVHVNMDKTDGIGLVNKREDTEESPPGGKIYRLSTHIDTPLVMDCTWDRDVMQPERFSLARISSLFSCQAPIDFEDRVRVKLLYDETCSMFLAYDTTCCLLKLPKEQSWQSFVYGESQADPFLIGMFTTAREECAWKLNILQCEQS